MNYSRANKYWTLSHFLLVISQTKAYSCNKIILSKNISCHRQSSNCPLQKFRMIQSNPSTSQHLRDPLPTDIKITHSSLFGPDTKPRKISVWDGKISLTKQMIIFLANKEAGDNISYLSMIHGSRSRNNLDYCCWQHPAQLSISSWV